MTTIDISQENTEEVGELIEQKVLETDQSEVVFGDIPDRFNYLELVVEATNTGTDDGNTILPVFNGDSDRNNYEAYRIRWDSDAQADVREDGEIGFIQSTDREAYPLSVSIEGYSNPDMMTTYISEFVQTNVPRANILGSAWDDKSVVTELKLERSSEDNSIASGSTFTLIGVE